MRSTAMLLGGMVLVGLGIGWFVGDLPGRWVFGPLLVLAGLAVKVLGLVSDAPDDGPRVGERQVTTLGGAGVERPRAGIPGGRAPLRTGRLRPGAVPRPAASSRPLPATADQPHRRAS